MGYKSPMTDSHAGKPVERGGDSNRLSDQASRFLSDRRHWRNILYVAAGGYGVALAWWSWQHQAELAAFALENQLPASGGPRMVALLGSAAVAVIIWLMLALLGARLLRMRLAATLGKLSALFLAATLLAFLPILAVDGIETDHVWLTYCLVAGMALIGGMAAWEFAAWRPRVQPSSHKNAGLIVTAVLATAYAGFMAALTLARHASFLTHAYDLGIQDQAFATILSRGYPLVTLYGETPVNQFGDHFTPIYYLLAPLYALVGDARALLIIQALVLGLAALPVYLLAQRLLRDPGQAVGVALAASFLLHPALHGVNTFDFHEIALALFLLLWALYFLESSRYGLMLVFLALAMLTKEEVSLTTAAIGLYLLLFRGQIRLGLLVSGASLVYFLAVNNVIMPALGGGPDLSRFAGLTPSDDSSLLALLGGILGNPVHAFSYAFLNPGKLAFLALLFLPVIFSPLWARSRWLTAAPAFAVALFSVVPSQYSIDYHYPAIMLPFVYYLAAAGLAHIRWWRVRPAAVAVAILVASLAMNWQYGWLWGKRYQPPPEMATHRQAIVSLLEAIPPQASVSAMSDLAPHLSNRERIYLLPVIAEAEFILFDSDPGANFWPFGSIDPRGEAVAYLLPHLVSGDYGLVREEDGVLLLQRGHDTSANPQAIATMLSATYPAAALASVDHVQELADPQASQGVARVSQGKPPGQEDDVGLLFGPYAQMQPGRYRVTYRLKLAEPGLAGRVATIDVFSHAAGGPLASADLDAAQFLTPGRYQDFAVEFEIEEPLSSVEFRVLHSGLGTLAVDVVQVTFLPDGLPGE
jgi:uncharacterized membrane protein